MFKQILVPVDGSEPAQRALTLALGLAAESGGRLRLVHVVDQAASLAGIDPAGGSSGHLYAALRDSGRTILQEALAVARARGVPADDLLVDRLGTRLGDAIARVAAEWGADLVVVGTHGRRGPSRLLLGSGAEQILRLSAVPVLVTRPVAGAPSKPLPAADPALEEAPPPAPA